MTNKVCVTIHVLYVILHMKEGAGKADACYSLFHLLSVIRLDLTNVDCFNGVIVADLHCSTCRILGWGIQNLYAFLQPDERH